MREPIIEVPDLQSLQLTSETKKGRFGGLWGPEPTDPVVGYVEQLLLAHRTDMLAARRAAHPDPEKIAWQARVAKTTEGCRDRSHPQFGRVSVALGDLPWRPQFDRPDRIPAKANAAIQALSLAPSVPLVADLGKGPLGIIGTRASALAVARHVVVTLATLTSADDLVLAVMADGDRAHEWAWADDLPHNHPGGDGELPVLVVDGTHHVADPAMQAAIGAGGEFAGVVIGESMDDLPPICATVVIIDDRGTAVVMDNTDGSTVMRATPLGITHDLAAASVASLSRR